MITGNKDVKSLLGGTTMPEPAKKRASYSDLYDLPENMTGEIIDGELFATPRPSRRHTSAVSSLGYKIGPAYQYGEGGGPGGWIIIIEPEIGLGENILVPDLAGWRKERFPESEDHNWISAAPDWVCEILSPDSIRTDRIKKMKVYAHNEIKHIWLIDPLQMTLEVYKFEHGNLVLLGAFAEDDKVRAEPFQEIEIDLGTLWLAGLRR